MAFNPASFAIPQGASQQQTIEALISGIRELVRTTPDGQLTPEQRAAVDGHLQAQAGVLQAAGQQAGRTVANRPLTPLPVFGQTANINGIRLNQLPEYGGPKDNSPEACLSWLEKIMDSAQANTLTEEATKDLLKAKATGLVYTSIAQMIRDQLALTIIVATLEVQFAGVIPASEAKTKCGRMEKDPKESVSTFALKLRKMAHIAARDEPTAVERTAMERELTATNLRRALPPSVKKDLEDREASRRDDGKPEWSLNDLIVQAELIDSRRQDRIAQMQEKRNTRYTPQYKPTRDHVRQVEEDVEAVEYGMEDLHPDTDPLDQEDDDEDAVAMIHAVREAERRGLKGPQASRYVRAVVDRKFRDRAPFQVYRPTGPPKLLKEVQVNRRDLPQLANVDREQCLQCGRKTDPIHKAKDLDCPLRGKEMTDRPCVKCGHGLHQADDCVVAFQTPYKSDPAKNGK